MFKFRKFRTNFNVYNGQKKNTRQEYVNTISISGAYRTNRDEFIHSSNPDPQRNSTPVPIPPPPLRSPPDPPRPPRLRNTKSTSDLIRDKNLPPNLRPAVSGISLDPRGAETETRNSIGLIDNRKQLDAQKRVDKQRAIEQKKQEKQQLYEEKKLQKQRSHEEKKRVEEQKKRDRLAAQEQARQEKLRKEIEKRESQQLKKEKKVKRAAPQRPLANPLAQTSSQALSNPLAQGTSTQNSTNTLDSSISKSSGPPPYSEVFETENENNSNVSFAKPIDTGSWDMISQHRSNVINRPMNTAVPVKGKMTSIDLNYNIGEEDSQRNSNA